MRIVLISVGTRGDMEPFLAIGEILHGRGHRVICAFPEQFRDLAVESNLGFASLGTGFIDMLESKTGKAAMGGSSSGFRKLLADVKLARASTAINKELIHRQHEIIEGEDPDRVVYNGKAIYPILWGLHHPGRNILVCPVPYMLYVRNRTHVAFNSNFGPALNKLTYALADFGLVTTTLISKKWLKTNHNVSRKQISHALSSNKAVYTISPSLFPKPAYWNENLSVLGFYERNKTVSWEPDKDLTDFLDKHPKVLFITFSSMSNPEPEKKTRIFTDILERNQIPAIINTAAGGLVRLEKFDTGVVHFVDRIPYDWIFPRIYAVIHNGGSGTTHLALKHGCASLIIPHIIDQFVWNRIIDEIGAGPRGAKAASISKQNLEPKILALMNNGSCRNKAEQVADKMANENFNDVMYQTIIG